MYHLFVIFFSLCFVQPNINDFIYFVQISPFDSIQKLKELIAVQMDIPVAQQKLVFQGKNLSGVLHSRPIWSFLFCFNILKVTT